MIRKPGTVESLDHDSPRSMVLGLSFLCGGVLYAYFKDIVLIILLFLAAIMVLSTLLCKFVVGQLLEDRQILSHFSYRGCPPV